MTAAPSEVIADRGSGVSSRRHLHRIVRLKTFCVAVCAGVAATATTSGARADVSFALSWRAEPGADVCVTEEALRDAVEQRLRRKPFIDPEHADIFIEADESAVGLDRFRARVTERDRDGVVRGVRVLEAQSCPSLRRAATLIVTLIIEPHLTGRRADEEPAAPPASVPDADVVEAPPAPPPPRPRGPERPLRVRERRTRPLHYSLGLGAAASVGVLPSPSATVLAVARLEPDGSRWSFDWWGGYSLPQHVHDGPVRGTFAAIEQRVRSCFGFVRWPTRKLDACGGIAWGAILPETVRVQRGSDHWRLLVGPTAAVAFEQQAGPFGGRFELGALLSLRQYDFSYVDLANERKAFYSTDAVVFFVALSGVGRVR